MKQLYVAPEVLESRKPYALSADIFLYGMTLFALTERRSPYPNPERKRLESMENFIRRIYRLKRKGKLSELSSGNFL